MNRDSRRMRRRTVTVPIEVVDTMTELTVGNLFNLSVGGLLLIASVDLVDDALYQFRFALPDDRGDPIEAGAHVLWRDAASAPGQYWVGLRFLGLAPEATQRLRAWIEADEEHDRAS